MGNDDDLTARPERRHAETTTRGVEHRTALLALRQPEVEDDAPVDQAAAAGMPFTADQIDHAQSRARAACTVGAECQR